MQIMDMKVNPTVQITAVYFYDYDGTPHYLEIADFRGLVEKGLFQGNLNYANYDKDNDRFHAFDYYGSAQITEIVDKDNVTVMFGGAIEQSWYIDQTSTDTVNIDGSSTITTIE